MKLCHTLGSAGIAAFLSAVLATNLSLAIVPTARGQDAPAAPAANESTPVDDPTPAREVSAAAPAADEAASDAPAADEPGPKVTFADDIWPILMAHCWKCHGPERTSGGLRLDTWESARAGGDSGKPILGGTLEDNELYQRVASPDRSYRMPKNAEALSELEIERIRQWVVDGAKWHMPLSKTDANQATFVARWVSKLTAFTDRYQYEYRAVLPYAYAFVGCQVLLLIVARWGAAYTKESAWTRRFLPPAGRFCSGVRGRELALVWMLLLVAGGGALLWIHGERLAIDLAKAEQFKQQATDPWLKTIYGSPPKPIHPGHPPQLAGIYYRGNCERNPELFNNGNYLTATFRIRLCDTAGRDLQVGDPWPTDGAEIRMELERAPGTTDTLYSKELIASVFLSEQFFGTQLTPVTKPTYLLDVVEEGQRWSATIPVGPLDEEGKSHGLIYICTGRIESERARGEPHYGIQYDLLVVDGKLDATSQIWMNSFGNSQVALPEPPGKIPYREWFDYRPIPVIKGENTKDPKLLGVDEYVKKGLIPPPDAPSADKPADAAPADAAQRDPASPE